MIKETTREFNIVCHICSKRVNYRYIKDHSYYSIFHEEVAVYRIRDVSSCDRIVCVSCLKKLLKEVIE